MDIWRKRRLVRFLNLAEPITDGIALLAIFGLFIFYLPSGVLRLGPATGGDMGSHFWPLVTMVNWGLPHGTLRVWNPGNLGGEPHLVHYFPLPFFLMAAFSAVMPLGAAFNLGTLLPVLIMPFAAYLCLRGIGARFPTPLLGATTTLGFLYNESYTMFGGNTLSTLAGQFAHTLAISVFLLAVGALCFEIRRRRLPLIATALFAAVAICHALLELVVPFALLSIWLLYPYTTLKQRFWSASFVGVGSLLLALWFLVAMVTNQKWTTSVPMSWQGDPQLMHQLFPTSLYPVMAFLIVVLPLLFLLSRFRVLLQRRSTNAKVFAGRYSLLALALLAAPSLLGIAAYFVFKFRASENSFDGSFRIFPFIFLGMITYVLLALPRSKLFDAKRLLPASIWIIPILACVVFYFTFTDLGLVDIRAVPQVQIFCAIAAAQLLGILLSLPGRLFAWLLTTPIVILNFWWVTLNVQNLPHWLIWNYGGWKSKPLYHDLVELTEVLRGDFSDPRVVYEHNSANEGTGTMRVFEMLPYFAGRSTLESLYLQATILSPQAFHIQAEVSKTPSCPIHGALCPKPDLDSAEPRLRLMGVGQLILLTPELLAQAAAATYLEKQGVFGQWSLFRLRPQPSLVEVLRQAPQLINATEALQGISGEDTRALAERVSLMANPDWMKRFYLWFRVYDGTQPFLVVRDKELDQFKASLTTKESIAALTDPEQRCSPMLSVGFNQLKLKTDCPGKIHLLKFAYHSSWKTDSGDHLALASPGFFALIPSRPEVTLTFGLEPIWKIADWISIVSAIVFFLLTLAKVIRYYSARDRNARYFFSRA